MASKQPTSNLADLLGSECPTCRQPRTQAWLARRLGRSEITVSRWARGERPIPADMRPLIAEAFGIDEVELGGTDEGTTNDHRRDRSGA